MVGNTGNFTTQDWATNMNKAASVGIQAFALNMAADWPYNSQSLEYAFAAAHTTGFKLFFSFDYPGGAYPWDQNVVINYLNKWGGDSNYWQHAPGKPLASTFEGPGNAADWHNIKAKTGCFFMPDWSSVGAFPAIGLAEGVADGLFSWAAWPYGKRKTDTYSDHSYIQALGGSDPSKGSTKPYMMPVSPWFFTNMPGFNKNWMWRGGNLWYERWQQVFELQPEYVQIISWNDFGESHYIGPLDDKQYEAFAIGRGDSPFNYVRDFDHTGWLTHLPFMIQRYLKGTAQFTKESAVVAHQVTLTSSCSGGGTTGNTASQLQLEFAPKEISPDSLYVAALLTAPASFSVSAPGKASYVSVADNKWDIIPDGGIGMYYKSVPMAGAGEHTITLRRGGSVLNEFKTTVQSTCYAGNMANWNARVTSSQWTNGFAAKTWSPTLTRAQQSCIQGWGEGNFNVICDYTCKNGYCPDSCVCENMGIPKPQKRADVTGPGYPKNGDANYAGLCDFACNRGFCPEGACSKTPVAQYIPKVSPFTPDTCVAGTTSGDFKSLCDFGCKYGYCPRNTCACSATGPLNLPPDVNDLAIKPRMFLGLSDDGLCNFGCSRGKDGRNVQCPLVCSN
ncbi:glycosyl hydrolase family 71-domain-containing protein, partial [Boeremia exigua]|uniref:glycosyl hydrolase family 71-domain-containing protein n=1 Tax=Boeremia exigua TaxID=749465 RepID=UPI001E8EC042